MGVVEAREEQMFTRTRSRNKSGLQRQPLSVFLRQNMSRSQVSNPSFVKTASRRKVGLMAGNDLKLSTREYWLDYFKDRPTRCEYTGLEFRDTPLLRPSVERIDNKLPYIPENICVIVEFFQGFKQHNSSEVIEGLVKAGIVPFTVLQNRRKLEERLNNWLRENNYVA